MPATPPLIDEPASLADARGLDRLCDRFEAAWRGGERPALEAFLAEAPAALRAEALRQFLLLDVEYRRLAGEAPAPADYLPRFADCGAMLAEVLAAGPVERAPESQTDLPAEADTLAREVAVGPTPAVPGYEILGELGRGAMGVVYRARQTSLGRLVALKMIRDAGLAGAEEVHRFRAEAQALARLQHPHIVQVHEVGTHEGRPYFVLEYVEGGSLDRRLGGALLAPGQAAELVQTLARAMDAAHQAGVVHRDLKPANVLVGADWLLKVTDFGLAKRLDDDSGRTRTGAVVGTPSYMAPEQAAGRVKDVGPAADVYALGAILYELLTGRPPFKGASVLDTLELVRSQEPLPPRRLNPKAPRDLETICLKCLQKTPARRYASAGELAEDLARFRRGEPIRARPVGPLRQTWRWCRRNPAVAALSAAAALLLVAGLLGMTGLYLDAERQRREAEEARHFAEQKEREALLQAEDARQKGLAAKKVTEFLGGMFQAFDMFGLERDLSPGGLGKRAEVPVIELLDRAYTLLEADAQLKKQPAIRAELLDTLGNVYRGLGVYDKARVMLEEGLRIRQAVLPAGHEDIASSLHNLGWLHQDVGEFGKAEELYRQALKLRECRFGKDSLQAAHTECNLAWVVGNCCDRPDREKIEAAAKLLRHALAVRQKELGPKHRLVGLTLAALGALVMPFKEAEARQCVEQAFQILCSDEHKDVGNPLNSYFTAQLLRQQGTTPAADKYYRLCLSQTSQLLGEDHPLVGFLLGDYAGYLDDLGKKAEAAVQIRKALAIGHRLLPKGHPAMIGPLLKLGGYEEDQGETSRAADCYREACAIARHFSRQNLVELAEQKLGALAKKSLGHGP
jgi:tetratricopeptide (TPR) repeat protein